MQQKQGGTLYVKSGHRDVFIPFGLLPANYTSTQISCSQDLLWTMIPYYEPWYPIMNHDTLLLRYHKYCMLVLTLCTWTWLCCRGWWKWWQKAPILLYILWPLLVKSHKAPMERSLQRYWLPNCLVKTD